MPELFRYAPHPRIAQRQAAPPAKVVDERRLDHPNPLVRFNARFGLLITLVVGTMWCAYLFTFIALLALPDALRQGTYWIIVWISWKLPFSVLLPIIIVGQNIQGEGVRQACRGDLQGLRGSAARGHPDPGAPHRPGRGDRHHPRATRAARHGALTPCAWRSSTTTATPFGRSRASRSRRPRGDRLHGPHRRRGRAARRLDGIEALVLIRERTAVRAPLLARLDELQLISQRSVYPHVDVAACTDLGIVVSSDLHVGTPSYATAELTWALVLAAARDLPAQVASMRAGGWQTAVGTTLRGRTLGVLGYGRIGAVVAGYAAAFGMPVLAWGGDGSRARARADGIEFASDKGELFERADVVTVHLRLVDATRGASPPPTSHGCRRGRSS